MPTISELASQATGPATRACHARCAQFAESHRVGGRGGHWPASHAESLRDTTWSPWFGMGSSRPSEPPLIHFKIAWIFRTWSLPSNFKEVLAHIHISFKPLQCWTDGHSRHRCMLYTYVEIITWGGYSGSMQRTGKNPRMTTTLCLSI